MDPLLEAALKVGEKIVHLVTVFLPAHTIRWTDGGFVRWGGEIWRAKDAIFGALDEIGEITDGIEEDPDPVSLTILPPDLTCLADLAGASAQGGRVTIHLGAVARGTGLLIGEPYRLFVGVLDRPVLKPGKRRVLEYDIQPGDAWGLIVSEEQRQTHAFRQMVWPGELGDQYASDGTKPVYWREDDPKNSVGPLLGRGVLGRKLLEAQAKDNRAIELAYEPEAALAFPIGRCAIKGSMRFRTGYGATNRYLSYVATTGASGPVQGVVRIEIDEEVITFDGSGEAQNGDHDHAMWFQFEPGNQPAPALTAPMGSGTAGIPPPGWTEDHRLSGRPCFIWTGVENSKKTEFGGGLPPVLVVQDGLYGWDPRVDADVTNRAAWPPMTDGAIAALNWVVGRWEGASGGGTYGVPYACTPVGGIAAPLDCIDAAAFAGAADIADANGWLAAGVLYSDEDKTDKLEDLLAAAGAKRARKCGLVSCVSFGAAKAATRTVTEADTASDVVETVLFPSLLDSRNTGIGRFLSEDNRWEITPIAPVSNPDWVAADKGRRTTTVDLPFVTSADQAAQLTYLSVAYDREGVGETPFKPWMMALEPGDAFDWAAPEFLLDGIKARVERRRYDPRRGRVRIRYRTETDSKYEEAMALVGTPPPPTVPGTPPPVYVEPPTDGVIDEIGLNVTLSYRNPVSMTFDFVDLMRAVDSTDFADAVTVGWHAGAAGEYVTVENGPVLTGHSYAYWLIAVDADGNRSDPDQPGMPLVANP